MSDWTHPICSAIARHEARCVRCTICGSTEDDASICSDCERELAPLMAQAIALAELLYCPDGSGLSASVDLDAYAPDGCDAIVATTDRAGYPVRRAFAPAASPREALRALIATLIEDCEAQAESLTVAARRAREMEAA